MKKLLCLSLFALATAFSCAGAQAQVIVIANPSVKAVDAARSDLKDIFSGASTSLGGSHVIPVLLKAGSVNDEFLAAYIGKTDAAFRASWRNQVFSGQATMPRSVDSDAAMVEYVAHNPGAVGYIGKASPHEGVKVIAVK
jgi:ABC-type phosphate transport system substrate-binding protein